jgi:hypothetical protein
MKMKKPGWVGLAILMHGCFCMTAVGGDLVVEGNLQVTSNASVQGSVAVGTGSLTQDSIARWDAGADAALQAVRATSRGVVFSSDFSSDPFQQGWTKNSYAWWQSGAVKMAVGYVNGLNGLMVYSNAAPYRTASYALRFTLSSSVSIPAGVNVRVYRGAVLQAGLYSARSAGQYILNWTSSWNRIELYGSDYYMGNYLYISGLSLGETSNLYVGGVFATDLYADRFQIDNMTAFQLVGVTNVVGLSPASAPSRTLRIASGTPSTSQNSGDVLIETAGGFYSTLPGSIVLRPGNNTYSSGCRGGSLDLYCGSGGNPNRTTDGAIRFHGLSGNGVSQQRAAMDSLGNWWVSGTVQAARFAAGDIKVTGSALLAHVPPQGDLSMGTFTNVNYP